MGDVLALPMEQNPLALYLAGLEAESSRGTMKVCIGNLTDIIGKALHKATPADLVQIKAELGDEYELATGNKHLSALRGYLKVANRLGLVSPETMRELPELRNFKGTRLPAGRMLSNEEIMGMLRFCPQEYPVGARDGAILAILRAGLRRQELVDLDLEHLDFEDGYTLKVRGKGNKERLVPMPVGGKQLLLKWLAHRGLEAGPLITSTPNLPQLHRLDTSTVDKRVKELWEKGGDKSKAVPSPHDFRRTLATELIMRGANIEAVQHLLGHASIETTLRYSRQPDEAKRAAMGLIPDMGENADG